MGGELQIMDLRPSPSRPEDDIKGGERIEEKRRKLGGGSKDGRRTIEVGGRRMLGKHVLVSGALLEERAGGRQHEVFHEVVWREKALNRRRGPGWAARCALRRLNGGLGYVLR